MTFSNQVILIGCGSIGSRYLKALTHTNMKCVVVDPKANHLSVQWRFENKKIIFVNDIHQIPNETINTDTVAIISNWGPDHFSTIKKLNSLSIRNFIIEKPVVSRIRDLDELENLVIKLKIKIQINQGWENEKYSENILEISKSLNLGEIYLLVVHGGARCMSTAGTHYIQVAQRLIQSKPISVYASLKNDRINPRHVNLSYLQGSFMLEFEDHKFLSINFSNHSFVEGQLVIYWREAIGIVTQNHINIFAVNPTRPHKDIVTRYLKPDLEIFNSNIVTGNINESEPFLYLIKSITDDKEYDLEKIKTHLLTTRILILGLVSSDTNKKVLIKSRIRGKYRNKDYKIS